MAARESEPQRTFYFLGSLMFIGALLYWAQPVLIPVALAILCTFILAPVVTFLERRGVHRFLASVISVLGTAVIIVGICYVLFLQLNSLISGMPEYRTLVNERIESLREASADTWLGSILASGADLSTAELPILPILRSVTHMAFEVLLNIVVILALALLMLLRREDLRNRLVRLFGTDNLVTTTRLLDDASRRLSRFLLSQLLLNVGFGIVIAIGLYFLNIPYAYLWGTLTALLRYIPFLGGWLSALLPMAMSLAMPGWQPLVSILIFFTVTELIQANLIEPLVFGHSVGVSAPGQLVAVLFWTCLWGPVGLILSTPLTAGLCVLGDHFSLLRSFTIIMGDEPVVTPPTAFYQRLLAGDAPEAADLVEDSAKANPPAQMYDEFFLPAFISAQNDYRNADLTAEDRAAIVDALRDIFQDVVMPLKNEADTPAPTDAEPRAKVLVPEFPFHDEVDHLISEMLPTLCPDKVQWLSASVKHGELSAVAEREPPDAVFLMTFAKRNLARLRNACRGFRNRFPDAKLIIACWRLEDMETVAPRLKAVGANAICTTFTDAQRAIEVEVVNLDKEELAAQGA